MKRDKREQRIRQNVRQVRFDDLDGTLRDHDFDGDDTQHHLSTIIGATPI